MIDSMFQAGTDQALNDQVRRPIAPRPAKPGFFDNFGASIPGGVGSGVSEILAFGAEISGAFGQVQGATGAYGAGGMFSTLSEDEQKQSSAARTKMLTQGIDMSNEAGDLFRQRAKEIMPDPAATGTAGQVVGGLLNFTTKAVGYTLTMGPSAFIALGGDVGLTEADRLKQQGVDYATRTKAGAVAGSVAAASLVVPMSGATAPIRAVKGVAIGEASMIGQSAAEKAILKAAGYNQQAETFDPFDPVSLGLGLVPGALGAKFGHAPAKPSASPRMLADMGLGERQALPYNDVQLDAYAVQAAKRAGVPPEVVLAVKNAGEKSSPTAVGPQTKHGQAVGVMQLLADTAADNGVKDRADPLQSIDGGARYLKKLHDQYGSWDAAIAHYNGGGAAAKAVLEGKAPPSPETQGYLQRVHDYMGKTLDDHVAAAVRAEPEIVDALRVQQAADAIEASRLTDDLAGRDAHVSAVEMAADQIGRGERVSVGDVLSKRDIIDTPSVSDDPIKWANKTQSWNAGESSKAAQVGEASGVKLMHQDGGADMPNGGRVTAVDNAGNVVGDFQYDTAPHGGIVVAAEVAPASRRMGIASAAYDAIERVTGKATVPDASHTPRAAAFWEDRYARQRTARTADAVNQLQAARQPAEPPSKPVKANAPEPTQAAKAPRTEAPAPAGSAGAAEPAAPAAGVSEPGAGATQAAGVAQATMDRAAAEVSMLHPDMLVQLDGMAEPMRVSELMDKVKEEAAKEKRDAKLIEVAALCALRQ